MKRGARHRRKAKALAKTLIATTLTAGTAGAAGAALVEESSVGGDFENLFEDANLLTGGTDEVTGENIGANFQSEPDFFKFSGLEPNVAFTLNAEWTGGGSRTSASTRVPAEPLDSAELNSTNSSPSPASLTGLIPGDGMLIFEASGGEGVNYKVTLSAPLLAPVPEPSTLALAALGAALTGVYARRRRNVRGGTTS